MSLQIIYGRSGTGKSEYIFKQIAKKIEEDTKRKIYIVTPEQFSFTAEKKLLSSISGSAVINAEVLTFGRMAHRVIQEKKRASAKMLSSCGKSMLVYDILADKKKELSFIGKSSENVELICTQITEFKKHGITVDILKDTIENIDDEYLKIKLNDMLKVYEKYNEEIEDKYMDENDNLSILISELENSDEYKNCDFYIDEFVGFTKQEYDIIRLLLRNNNIYITSCMDLLEESDMPDTDVFYSNKKTMQRILDIANEESVDILKPVFLNEKYRFKNEELSHLEENIYGMPYKIYDKKIENIELFLANNQYSEIEYVCEEIVKLVRDKGYKYNEISIITKSLDSYSNLCKAIFGKYNIPVFIDEKQDLSQNVLVRYMLAVLNIYAKNWSFESVFEYIKTGFLDIDPMDIHILENYALKWGIKANKWYLGEWNFYDESDEEKEKILHIRELLIVPLTDLKRKLAGQKDVKDITKCLYNFLIEQGIDKKLENKIAKLQKINETQKAQEYETSWKVIMNVLDEIVNMLGDKKVSFEKYADILKMGLGASGLGKIPITQDQVIVGDVDRSRSHKVKAVFIIGLNDGAFPGNYKDEGFFNDNDRERLKQKGAELAKGSLELLYDDNFNIYKAFSTSEEKLYLSYASSELEGKQLRPSIFINRIKKIFPKLIEKSDVVNKDVEKDIINEAKAFEDLLDTLRKWKDENDINEDEAKKCAILYQYFSNSDKWKDRLKFSMQAMNYTNVPEDISKEEIQKLYGNTLRTSISRLEQYKSCPFSYYLKYGLKLSDKSEFKIEAVDTGTFMHDVIDSFFEKVEESNLNIKLLDDDKIQKIVDEIIDEKLQLKQNYIFTSIPKYRVLAGRLKKVIKQSMKYIVDSLKFSKFDVLGHEMEFKSQKEYPPIKIKLENGKTVEITGKIDRIDIAKTADGNYIRIIDYKSSVKDINLNEVKAGLQLQLLTYMDAVCEIEDVLPAGVLYFNLIDPTIKANSHLSQEEIEFELRKQFKMKGLILADIDVAQMMDTNLEKGSSNVIPAYVDKDGNLSQKSSSVTRKQFEDLQKYTKNMLSKISEEILSGKIDVKPYYKVKGGKTPCEYCSYKSICQFNNGICKNSYYYIGNINKDAIIEQIAKQEATD